ncbi:MAG: FGGY family carbohydrate kinase [Acidiferrobacterales bacterium]
MIESGAGMGVLSVNAPHYLAIDQGGHASRALLFDEAGCVIGRGIREVHSHEPCPGWVEQDPEEVVRSVVASIEEALAGQGPAAVAAAGLATQRSSIVCWRRHSGRALSQVISWQDRRAKDWLLRFGPEQELVQASTGLRLSPHYGASKLRWCLDHLPAVREAWSAGDLCFGPLASFLVYRLTLERSFLIDPANAARTLLYNLEARDWDRKLLQMFGIPRAPLPRCVPTRYCFGRIPVGGQAIPLKIVTGDQSAALFAWGAPQPAFSYVNIGTGAFIQRPCGPQPEYHPRLLSGIVFADHAARSYVLEGTVNGAGSALRWIQRELGMTDLDDWLAVWLESEREPALFLNGVGGLGAPFWVADFVSRFIGSGNPRQKAVGVAESVVFLIHENLKAMRASGPELERVVVSGGLARIDGLCQRLADLSRLPAYRPAEQEATARGVANLLANHSGAWTEPQSGVWFMPVENARLGERYHHWRMAMDQALERRLFAP